MLGGVLAKGARARARMLERKLYADLVRGMVADGWLAWRLPDAPGLPERPADIAGCTADGLFVFCEVKVCGLVGGFKGVAGLHFEGGQVRWLRACAARGGLALVCVYETGERSKKRMLLVQVMGQGAEGPDGEGGGLVGLRSAVLRRTGRGWQGWKEALVLWNDRGPMEYGR